MLKFSFTKKIIKLLSIFIFYGILSYILTNSFVILQFLFEIYITLFGFSLAIDIVIIIWKDKNMF